MFAHFDKGHAPQGGVDFVNPIVIADRSHLSPSGANACDDSIAQIVRQESMTNKNTELTQKVSASHAHFILGSTPVLGLLNPARCQGRDPSLRRCTKKLENSISGSDELDYLSRLYAWLDTIVGLHTVKGPRRPI